MQAIFDHLTAVILGAGVILLLGAAWVIASKSSTEAALGYQARTLSGAAITLMERDFRNIGSGVPTSEQAILQMQAAGPNRVFEFKSTIDPADDAEPVRIRYEVTDRNPATCEGEPPCYSLTRNVWNGSSWDISGPNNVTLSRFSLKATPLTASLDDIQRIEISLAYEASGTAQQEFSWENTFYLTALDIRRGLE